MGRLRRGAAAAAAVAAGAGAVAAGKRRRGRRARPGRTVQAIPYGSLRGERERPVRSFDNALIRADEFGPADAATGAVLVHGYGVDTGIWHHQLLDLGGGRRYVCYDARGHGRTGTVPGTPIDPVTMARDLKAVLDASGLTKALLVGHSMGGMVVLEFCRQFPEELGERVAGLALLNTTAADPVATFALGRALGTRGLTRKAADWLLADPRRVGGLRLREGPVSRRLVRAFGFGPDATPEQVGYALSRLAAFPTPALAESLRALLAFDASEILPKIAVPLLVVGAEGDRVIAAEASRRIAAAVAGARLVVLREAGHASPLERHAEVTPLLRAFLETTLG